MQVVELGPVRDQHRVVGLVDGRVVRVELRQEGECDGVSGAEEYVVDVAELLARLEGGGCGDGV